jgi:hypothetical protein
MNDLLLKLRQQLTSMIEEIDSFNNHNEDTIFIKKEDFKSISFLGNSTVHSYIFEYQNGVKFILDAAKKNPYHHETYTKLMNGTLELLILNKLDKEHISKGHTINYKLEVLNKTLLRNLY